MTKLFIFHFAPLELYPPVQNLIQELAASQDFSVQVFTSASSKVKLFKSNGDVRIHRLFNMGGQSSFKRVVGYIRFNVAGIAALIWNRPSTVLYFETLSSLPPVFYKRFINRSARLLIHYHEYATKQEIASGPSMVAALHAYESEVYDRASWVSHTNEARLKMFMQDVRPSVISHPFVLPNFPPHGWQQAPKRAVDLPLKVVYCGALSLTTMYTKEFAAWVIAQGGKVLWDIYTYNFSTDTKQYLEELECDWIRFLPGIAYDELPGILPKYHLGIILYKGHILNYIYNAPNKLFEYLACGLDVLVPDVMIGSVPYVDQHRLPKVIALNFNEIPATLIEELANRNYPIRTDGYFCEDALAPLIEKLKV